jgi:hypothetical protein
MIKRLTLIVILILISYFLAVSQSYDTLKDSIEDEYEQNETIDDYDEEGTTEEYDQDEATDEYSTNDYLLDSLKEVMSNYDQECNVIKITYNGYESGNDETYYFDSLAVICAYHSKWGMEGTSGEEFYWFDNGKLSFVYDEKYGQEDEPEITFLSNLSDYHGLREYESDINKQKQDIYDLIRQNQENITKDEYAITIDIEQTQNYGIEFVETTNIYIDKILFEQLFKE